MPQKNVGVVVEKIKVRVDDKNVTVYAIVSGVQKVIFKEPKDKLSEKHYGAIAIRFAPTKE